MRKASILTLHFYDNFGSVLQAYALKTIVMRLGWDAQILPYKPDLPKHTYFSDPSLLKQYEEKKNKFRCFREQALRVYEPFQMEITDADSDAFIVGSDIVWGKEFSGLSSEYFLDFVHSGRKRISYAASLVLREDGRTEDDALFRHNLNAFDAVSVRERSSVEAVQRFTSKEVEDVLDPTLLLAEEDYLPIMKPFEGMPKQPYMLSYFLTHDPAVVNYTNILAERFNLIQLHFFADYPRRIFTPKSECFAFAGPGEFLSCVKNASFIFTNSYHGTCFAVNFNRPFYSYVAERDLLSRVMDLTEKLGLENRRFGGIADLNEVNMDCTEPHGRLFKERKKSIEFLRAALEG